MSSSPPPSLIHESSYGSTSTSSGHTTSSSTTKAPRSHHAKSRRLAAQPLPLKPIAAKPPTPAKRWQPLLAVTRYASKRTLSETSRKILVCAVCERLGCQLVTHQTLASRTLKPDTGTTMDSNLVLISDEAYKSSYAYRYAHSYVDTALAQGRVDAFHNLPLPSDLDTTQNHSLFHHYFSYETKQGLEVPKLAHVPDDLVLDPFFIVAMQDTDVCLSVLALAAAQLPTQQTSRPNQVRALEFSDRAVASMRERTNTLDPPSDAVIIAHVFLWAVAMFLQEKKVMQEHANIVCSLVRTRGGLRCLGLQGKVEQLVRFVDARHSLIAHTASMYRDAPNPPALADMPPKKYGSFWETERSMEIISQDVLDSCRGICTMIEVVEETFVKGMTMPTMMWLMGKILFLTASRSRVLQVYAETGTFDECVILANELALHHALDNVKKQRNAVLFQAKPLVKAVRKIDEQFPQLFACTNGETELFVWVFFLISMVPHDFDGKDWVRDLLCRFVRAQLAETSMTPSNWIERIWQSLVQFTWSNHKYREGFNKICKEIQVVISRDNNPS